MNSNIQESDVIYDNLIKKNEINKHELLDVLDRIDKIHVKHVYTDIILKYDNLKTDKDIRKKCIEKCTSSDLLLLAIEMMPLDNNEYTLVKLNIDNQLDMKYLYKTVKLDSITE